MNNPWIHPLIFVFLYCLAGLVFSYIPALHDYHRRMGEAQTVLGWLVAYTLVLLAYSTMRTGLLTLP